MYNCRGKKIDDIELRLVLLHLIPGPLLPGAHNASLGSQPCCPMARTTARADVVKRDYLDHLSILEPCILLPPLYVRNSQALLSRSVLVHRRPENSLTMATDKEPVSFDAIIQAGKPLQVPNTPS